MFDNFDLSVKIDRDAYDKEMPAMKRRLGELQRLALKHGMPSIVVFEGGGASGKGDIINRLINPIDARGYDVYPIEEPKEDERMRPFFWRFWVRTPAQGRIAIFSRSWYHRTLAERRAGGRWPARGVSEIQHFERQLADGGCLIEKFFLHISKKEQRSRFKKLEADPAMAWMVTEEDWQEHKGYRQYLASMEKLIEKTDTQYAPWTIVEAEDRSFAEHKVYSRLIKAFERGIERILEREESARGPPEPLADRPMGRHPSVLDLVDLSKALPDDAYGEKLKKCLQRVARAQCDAYHGKIPVVVLFEGWDAAGKGGDIKRLTEGLDPRRYTVVPIGSPDDAEKAHNYLWRFWLRLPPAAQLTIFDRSWYGRVLVERVEGLCRREEWQRAYGEINEMEEQLIDSGAVLVKLWLHIDKDTQLKRFEERVLDPDKEWKITQDDWRNRSKWEEYHVAVDEMLYRTSTTCAPWTIVESNDKNYSRVKTLETVADAIEKRVGRSG